MSTFCKLGNDNLNLIVFIMKYKGLDSVSLILDSLCLHINTVSLLYLDSEGRNLNILLFTYY